MIRSVKQVFIQIQHPFSPHIHPCVRFTPVTSFFWTLPIVQHLHCT